ncbi:MAG: hypothetical protein ABJD97_16350 [Betaproteobacteria bacterium]
MVEAVLLEAADLEILQLLDALVAADVFPSRERSPRSWRRLVGLGRMRP